MGLGPQNQERHYPGISGHRVYDGAKVHPGTDIPMRARLRFGDADGLHHSPRTSITRPREEVGVSNTAQTLELCSGSWPATCLLLFRVFFCMFSYFPPLFHEMEGGAQSGLSARFRFRLPVYDELAGQRMAHWLRWPATHCQWRPCRCFLPLGGRLDDLSSTDQRRGEEDTASRGTQPDPGGGVARPKPVFPMPYPRTAGGLVTRGRRKTFIIDVGVSGPSLLNIFHLEGAPPTAVTAASQDDAAHGRDVAGSPRPHAN